MVGTKRVVVARNTYRRRRQPFFRLLNAIEAGIPVGTIVHGISTTTPCASKARVCLDRHKHFVFDLT